MNRPSHSKRGPRHLHPFTVIKDRDNLRVGGLYQTITAWQSGSQQYCIYTKLHYLSLAFTSSPGSAHIFIMQGLQVLVFAAVVGECIHVLYLYSKKLKFIVIHTNANQKNININTHFRKDLWTIMTSCRNRIVELSVS